MEQEANYAERVRTRADTLQRNSIRVLEDTVRARTALTRVSQDLSAEFARLRADLADLEEECARTAQRVRTTVGLFRSVIKKAELARLQSRIDLWAPEKRVSRVAFRKMLRDTSE